VTGWTEEGGALRRTFTFRDFAEAMAFVNRMAALAEEMNHHPDFCVRWNRVEVSITTHDAGGVTELDRRLAAKLSS
jgi:4a-hydroxytetrahydrobiopterin dehydratase